MSNKLDFTVDRIPFEVVISQQRMVDQLYQQGTQMQQMQPADPNKQPVQQQNVGE